MQNQINKTVFGKRLKQLMKNYHETTYSLGEHFNLSPPSISRYTRGEMVPKMTTLHALADYFDVNPEWLMGHTVSMYASEILDSNDDIAGSTYDISVFREIRYDRPVFSNQKTDEHITVPIDRLSTWGPVFGYRMPDDSMAPEFQKGDLLIIRLDTNIRSGKRIALHVDKQPMIIRKTVLSHNRLITQPVNPAFDAGAYQLRKNFVQFIGQVVYCLHRTEKYYSLDE